MCIGYENSHFQCGHIKTFGITQQCENALATRRGCSKDQCSFVGNKPVKPPLCYHCYRLTEKEINDEFRKKRHEIWGSLDNDHWDLEMPDLTATEQDKLEKQIEKGKSLMSKNLKETESALNEVRETQRVWGGRE